MMRHPHLLVVSIAAALAALAAGCAHAPDPGLRVAAPPHPAVAADVIRQDEPPLAGVDGTTLYVQSWRARDAVPRAVVLLQHGLKDEGDRYEAFAERLVRAGYLVQAMDLPGHGRSAGPRTSIADFEIYVHDLAALLARVRQGHPGVPVFVMGHSMGGEVVARLAEEHPDALAGVILSAPALGLDAPALKAALARLAGWLAPGAPALDLPEADFSRVPAVVASMRQDALISHPPGPARTVAAILAGTEAIWGATERVTLPVLVLHGTEDRLTSPAASRDFVARIPSADKRLILYDGAWHVLLDDPVGPRVAADVVAWLDAHAGGVGAATPAPAGDVATTTRRLRGDRRLAYQALAVVARLDGLAAAREAAGILRLRLGAGDVDVPGGALGWGGGMDLRAGYSTGAHVGGDLFPLGLTYRTPLGVVGLAAGAGIGGDRTLGTARALAELWYDGAGPVPLVLRLRDEVTLNHRPTGVTLGDSAVPSAVIGVRLGGTHHYWGRTIAGAGLVAAATWSDALGWGVLLGLDAAGWQ